MRLTREELVRLGQSSRPWEFIPAALRALAGAPDDAAVRFLLAANLARLQLRTAAAEQLARLSSAAQREPNVRALGDLLRQLPDDVVPLSQRVDWCARNLGVIRRRGIPLPFDPDSRFRAWALIAQGVECFRAAGGNLLRRSAPPGGDGAWIRFADDAGDARTLELPPVGPGGKPPPWIVEGVDPPWLFQRIAAATPRQADGYWPRITLVQADIDEFLDGLSMADLTAELSQDRVHLIVGEAAAAAIISDLEHRCGVQIAGPSVVCGGVRKRIDPAVDRLIDAGVRRQLQEETHLLEAVGELYDGRDRAWWGKRWAEAGGGGSGGGEPLRVLIPTCRYTTYVQHAAADLAGALRRAGCEARILIEPDDSSVLASVAYLRAVLDFQPDLVLLTNYTRAHLGHTLVHPNIPCVCWIQDAMPHLFDASIGRRQTDLDFVAGLLHHGLFERFGYSRDRSVAFSLVASPEKFHPGAVTPSRRQRLECEIALVSHHSEPPERLHQRLCADAAATPAIVRILERLYPQVQRIAGAAATEAVQPALRAAAAQTAREVLARDADDRTLTLLVNNYAMPVADRLIRHETLGWAADLADARGWRLKIHGRGWESHPRFGRFAAGELEHGEDLRASYQCAAVHLHASMHWNYHQRVMECALSGGLPLCRRKEDDVLLLGAYTECALAERGTPIACRLSGDRALAYAVADRPESLAYAALLARLGHPRAAHWTLWSSAETLDRVRTAWRGMPMEDGVAWLLGDMAQTTFANRGELESAVDRAIARPAWRADCSAGIASRVRAQFTTDSAAHRILGLVRGSLTAPAAVRA